MALISNFKLQLHASRFTFKPPLPPAAPSSHTHYGVSQEQVAVSRGESSAASTQRLGQGLLRFESTKTLTRALQRDVPSDEGIIVIREHEGRKKPAQVQLKYRLPRIFPPNSQYSEETPPARTLHVHNGTNQQDLTKARVFLQDLFNALNRRWTDNFSRSALVIA
ncbi:hypothetical protein FA95DRAFT_1576500 [Auriscalpium vulgare]|uniref:Uncharacterized protein n=1 Tax=Auriscalpium vulgare TaxID=40419 RepID=A0ACB8RC17_9AGAM|nr:hypothetical protein FA95DRAFT_1576500 [Auriscalpium vulgare]